MDRTTEGLYVDGKLSRRFFSVPPGPQRDRRRSSVAAPTPEHPVSGFDVLRRPCAGYILGAGPGWVEGQKGRARGGRDSSAPTGGASGAGGWVGDLAGRPGRGARYQGGCLGAGGGAGRVSGEGRGGELVAGTGAGGPGPPGASSL